MKTPAVLRSMAARARTPRGLAGVAAGVGFWIGLMVSIAVSPGRPFDAVVPMGFVVVLLAVTGVSRRAPHGAGWQTYRVVLWEVLTGLATVAVVVLTESVLEFVLPQVDVGTAAVIFAGAVTLGIVSVVLLGLYRRPLRAELRKTAAYFGIAASALGGLGWLVGYQGTQIAMFALPFAVLMGVAWLYLGRGSDGPNPEPEIPVA